MQALESDFHPIIQTGQPKTIDQEINGKRPLKRLEYIKAVWCTKKRCIQGHNISIYLRRSRKLKSHKITKPFAKQAWARDWLSWIYYPLASTVHHESLYLNEMIERGLTTEQSRKASSQSETSPSKDFWQAAQGLAIPVDNLTGKCPDGAHSVRRQWGMDVRQEYWQNRQGWKGEKDQVNMTLFKQLS